MHAFKCVCVCVCVCTRMIVSAFMCALQLLLLMRRSDT